MCIPDRLSVVQCSHGHVIGVAFFWRDFSGVKRTCWTTGSWRSCLSLEVVSSIPAWSTIIYRFLCGFICVSLCQSIKIKPTNMYVCMYVCICIYVYMYIYIYMYIKWTVFVNVTTKSAQHAHARMIAIIGEKSPNSSHMYDHGFMDNTNRQAVKNWLDSQTRDAYLTSWRQPFCNGRTYDLSLDFFQQLYICIYIYMYICIYIYIYTYVLDS